MLDLSATLQDLGTPKENIHFELFATDASLRKAASTDAQPDFDPNKESKVEVITDGSHFKFSLPYGGTSVLDAALAAGGDLPFACKGGVCCTCKARLLKGQVDMDVNYALEPDEVEAGYILTCQSHPRSAEIVVDFDV